jgi:hypothetical protein
MLRDYARPRKTAPSADNRILLIPVADLQIGKIDGGGTESTIERFARLTQDIADEIRATTKGKVPAIVLAYAGDCLEGPVSQGGRLVTRLDLSLTEQLRVYRRLLTHQIGVLAPLCDRMLVMLLPGNHDERRGSSLPSPRTPGPSRARAPWPTR